MFLTEACRLSRPSPRAFALLRFTFIPRTSQRQRRNIRRPNSKLHRAMPNAMPAYMSHAFFFIIRRALTSRMPDALPEYSDTRSSTPLRYTISQRTNTTLPEHPGDSHNTDFLRSFAACFHGIALKSFSPRCRHAVVAPSPLRCRRKRQRRRFRCQPNACSFSPVHHRYGYSFEQDNFTPMALMRSAFALCVFFVFTPAERCCPLVPYRPPRPPPPSSSPRFFAASAGHTPPA